MMKRKKCEYCNQKLMAFKDHYLHPDNPCEGNSDSLDVTAKIVDDFLYKKFIEKNGKPLQNDYERLNQIENNWLVKAILPFIGIIKKIKEKIKKP